MTDYLQGHAVVIASHGIDLTLDRQELEAFAAVKDTLGGRLRRVTDMRTGETWPKPCTPPEVPR